MIQRQETPRREGSRLPLWGTYSDGESGPVQRMSRLVVLVGLVMALAIAQVGMAAGPIDADGTWDIQMAGDIGFTCDNATVKQTGTSVSFLMVCVASKSVTATFSPSGMIDTTTGAFTALQILDTGQFGMTGTVDKSGDGMSGSWKILFGSSSFQGTFTGIRQSSSPTTPVPVGGISLDSDLRPLPLETTNPDSLTWSVAVGIVAAGIISLGGAAWYARKRLIG